MKRFFTILTLLLTITIIKAQSPEKISYQAVIRDANNNLVTEQEISMQISILQGTVGESAVYSETHLPTTNENGVASIEIGGGTIVSGLFAGINWKDGPYFIKTEIDPTGGSTYTITGTNQLLSVPYALHAKTAEFVTGDNGNLQFLTRDEILDLTPAQGNSVYNITENLFQIYNGTNWASFQPDCWPEPTYANAGNDHTLLDGTVSVSLSANMPDANYETGQWRIVSGNGGSFADPSEPNSTFNGILGETYTLRWTINSICSNSTDEVTISFLEITGTYTVEFATLDSHGWKAFIEFTLLSDETISEVDFDDLDSDGNRKTEDSYYNEQWINITGINAEIAYPQIEVAVENTQISPDYVEIDAVSGATASSNDANILMTKGLEAIKNGQTGTIIIERTEEK